MSLDINKHVCEYICVCIYIYVGNNSTTTIHAGHYLSDKVYTHTHTDAQKHRTYCGKGLFHDTATTPEKIV